MVLHSPSIENAYIPPIYAKRDELRTKHQEKQSENNWEYLDKPLTAEEQEKRDEIIRLNPLKIKVFCNAGKNRSAFVASILNGLGYEADNSGTGGATPFNNEDLERDYDAVIFVTKDVEEMFKQRAEFLGLQDTFANVPTRILGFSETGVFYLEEENKNKELEVLKPKILRALDRQGFINKKTDHPGTE